MNSIQKSKSLSEKKLYLQKVKGRYAVRSMFAGAFLTMSTAAGFRSAKYCEHQPSAKQVHLRIYFYMGFGIHSILERGTCNIKHDVFNSRRFPKHIKWSKALTILLYCGIFNLIGAMIVGAVFAKHFSIQRIRSWSIHHKSG